MKIEDGNRASKEKLIQVPNHQYINNQLDVDVFLMAHHLIKLSADE